MGAQCNPLGEAPCCSSVAPRRTIAPVQNVSITVGYSESGESQEEQRSGGMTTNVVVPTLYLMERGQNVTQMKAGKVIAAQIATLAFATGRLFVCAQTV